MSKDKVFEDWFNEEVFIKGVPYPFGGGSDPLSSEHIRYTLWACNMIFKAYELGKNQPSRKPATQEEYLKEE